MESQVNQKSTVASYNHLTQTIHLNQVEQADVEALAAALAGSYRLESEVVPQGIERIVRPMIHELRHWVDMNCTVRGLDTIERIFALMRDPQGHNPEIRHLKKELSLVKFIEPYTPGSEQAVYPWRFDITLSEPRYHERLNHLSICFYSGTDRNKSKIIFKSPLYLGSMLEANASFQEYRDAIPLLIPHAAWDELKHFQQQDARAFMEDPTRPEYHCLAHAFAAATQNTEMLSAFAFASGIVTLLMHLSGPLMSDTHRKIRYWGEKQKDRLLPFMDGVTPEAVILRHCIYRITEIAADNKLEPDEDLIFELLPHLKSERNIFYERSHEQFQRKIMAIQEVAPAYFRDAAPALIECNRYILEQQTLNPTILRLPKRPPIFCGDGYVLHGAAEFNGLEPNFYQVPEEDLVRLLEVKSLEAGLA